MNTFSVGFEERGFDERPYSRRVADRFGTNHRELVVRGHAAAGLPKIIRALDEPVADSAAIPTYFMAELTKPHVTVVLTGEGADELFAGYSHYKILAWADRLSAVSPAAAVRFVLSAFSRSTAAARCAEYAASLKDRPAAYLALKSVFTRTEKARLFSDAAEGIVPAHRAGRRSRPPVPAAGRRAVPAAVAAHGPGHVAAGRPAREGGPDDDGARGRGARAVPGSPRRRAGHAHAAVVEAGRHSRASASCAASPRTCCRGKSSRRRKTGFAVPVGQWAADEMQGLVRELLGADSVRRRGLFEPAAVAPLLGRDRYGMFERRQLWTLICLEMWCREFLD